MPQILLFSLSLLERYSGKMAKIVMLSQGLLDVDSDMVIVLGKI
jgi:hypothetical protein